MFKNRGEAGLLLCGKLQEFKDQNPIILSIPRGGVVVGKVISEKLNLLHDILVVKKIGAPQNPELAIGAVGPKETVYWDENLCQKLGMKKDERLKMKDEKLREAKEQEKKLRAGKTFPEISGKTVIVVDDGVATGATVMASYKFLKRKKSGKIILAVPVIALETYQKLSKYMKVIYLHAPISFRSVGQFYEEFPQVEDEEVIDILKHRA